MDADSVLEALQQRYDGVVVTEAWGERGLFYNPGEERPRGAYVVTVKDHDCANDTASALDRDGVSRLNVGISEETYRERFGDPPDRPSKGDAVDLDDDFTALDTLLPHPTYAWATWVCVLSPSAETFESLAPLFDETYDRACATFHK